jgi:hypothetical protein
LRCKYESCRQLGSFRNGYCFVHYVEVFVPKVVSRGDADHPEA